PFENLGDPEDEYFADGITDEITSRLAVTGDLHVISRTSANQYKGTQKGLPEIARELNVDYILEGTIRWDHSGETSRVRITPQLIQVVDDRHLWAQNYERTLTQIFAVQADIATNIAEALNITLLQRERQPTEDIEAYNAYLRGKYYMERPDYFESDYRMAVEMFERAASLDQGFALAHAWLARAHLALYHQGYDRTEGRRALSRTSVDRALELDPNLGEAHLSLGVYFYWGHRDYDRALAELKIAGNLLPNNADVLTFIAAVYRRQGGFEEAADLFKRSFELNPRSTQVAIEIMYTLHWMRRYEEAMDYCNECISLAPDQMDAYELKSRIHINWHGDIQQARKALVEMSPSRTNDRQALAWYNQAWMERDFRAALDSIATMQSDIDINQTDFIPVSLRMALAFQQSGLDEQARRFFDSALFILEREAQTRPEDYRIRQSLGLAYAGLGEVEDAVREAEYAAELFPMSKDAFFGSYVVIDLAIVYTMTGKYEEALDRLEYLLARPANISVSRLRVDPRWDPLRDHPRFQALLEKYEKIHGT
ncbi:MAG: hypothetical protein JSU65_02380, partial [Candidatus Zixiibacteriota bacterium]